MSEQNILNPTQTSLLNPDWGYSEGLPEMRTVFQAASGKPWTRRQFIRGRSYQLEWKGRDLATKHALQQWERQYENDFFSLSDYERSRYFTGRFEGPLLYTPVGNQQYNVRGTFVELPGLAMFAYPTNWSRDAIFLEERDGFGNDLVKLTGASWTYSLRANAHGGAAYTSGAANDTAEWIYFGYGFRFWSEKGGVQGIVELSATRIRDGSVVQPATSIDLYAAVDAVSAPLQTVAGLGLDLYRVKLRVTGTKNASSAGYECRADAIEVMQ